MRVSEDPFLIGGIVQEDGCVEFSPHMCNRAPSIFSCLDIVYFLRNITGDWLARSRHHLVECIRIFSKWIRLGQGGCEAKWEAQAEALSGVTWPSNAPGARPCQNSDLKLRSEIRSKLNLQRGSHVLLVTCLTRYGALMSIEYTNRMARSPGTAWYSGKLFW